MIRIKFEVEEEETPLPIENENERIKRILSLKFFGNNLNNSTSDNTNNGNNNNVCGILKQKLLPELNGVVPKKVVSKEKKQLDNSTTDSVAVGSKSIKTEPVESSLSLTTQLNNSLNIQSLLRQNRIQNGWTTNEQSIPIGTQQQQQSLFSTKTEPIFSEIHQEVLLSLDLSSLISNLNSEQSVNYDTGEIPSLVQSVSIPIGTQQQQQSFLSTKIEPIVPEIHQEVPLSLDQNSSLIPNLNFVETTTTATNCDIMENSGLRAGLGRRAKLNVCYSVPKKPNHFTTTTAVQMNSDSADNLESTNNNDDNYSDQDCTFSGSGSISGVDPSSSTGPSLPPEAAVPFLVGKKAARQRETSRLRYFPKKANPKMEQLVDPEVKAEKQRRRREYNRKCRQQRLANATPEQRKEIRLKHLEKNRRYLEKESEEHRKQRLERMKQYDRTVKKQRMDQLLASATPEQLEQKRLKGLEAVRRHMEKETEEQRKRRLEQKRQYYNMVGKQRRMEQKRLN